MKTVLAEALRRRLEQLPAQTTCFRWVDLELPDVTVDLFSGGSERPGGLLETRALAGHPEPVEGSDGTVRMVDTCASSARRAVAHDSPALRQAQGARSSVAWAPPFEVAVLSVYSEAAQDQALELAHALSEARALRAVYVKRRPREARALASQTPAQLAPAMPLLGQPVEPFTALEAGAAFEIRPENGLSVGLYLDARDARAWVQGNASGRRVLNTFAYTCGFGLAALRGGATRAVNLDLSRKVLDWGERNYAHNQLQAARYDFISGDTFDWLGRFAKKQEQFELVVLDPPGFATLKRGRFSAARDYHLLVEAAAPVVAPGGLLLAMCNVEALDFAGFEAQLAHGLGARRAKRVTAFGASAVDYRQPSALKCLVYELA